MHELKLKFSDAVKTNKMNYNKYWMLENLETNKELHDLAKNNEWEKLTIAITNLQLMKHLIPSGILTNETLVALTKREI